MKPTFAGKSEAVFRQIAFIIMAVSALAGFLFFRIYRDVYSYAGALIHKIKTACECASMAQLMAMHPFIFVALAALSLIVLTFLFYAVYKLVKLIIQTRRFTAQYLTGAKFGHSSKLRRAILNLNLDKSRIIEVRELKPVVFCFGLWRPKVCVSSGLVKIMSQDELEAVLLHEHHHLIHRGPLKLFIIKCFQNVFGWLPGIKTCAKRYITFSELAADELATNNFTDKSKLAQALFKISENEEKQLLRSGLALSFFSSVIAERVNKLSDDGYAPRFNFWGKKFVLGLGLVVSGLLSMFILLSDSASALAMHDYGGCSMNNTVGQNSVSICTMAGQSYRPATECHLN